MTILATLGCGGEVRHGPGPIAPLEPVQEPVEGHRVYRHGSFTVRPVARYTMQARVLGRERYRSGRDAELSPLDLALGWGPMSDDRLLDRVDISQHGRFYYWRGRDASVPARDVAVHSANVHLIPADDAVREALLAVREGDVVYLDGHLVVASAEDGWTWRTSLSRTDAGAGACELFRVSRVVAWDDPARLPDFAWWRAQVADLDPAPVRP